MTAYYNELDPYAAQWLRNLIEAGLIPPGEVDERSIVDVEAADLRQFRQCHFFAGIGGWALAARAAGWPDDREIWTGSPPCQPFSVAGQGKAQADDRHLWPHLFRLLSARRPAVFMGEQVAAAVGKNWLDGVLADLESIDYAGRGVVVPACAVDAPHRRDRLWFVADTSSAGLSQRERIAGVLRSLGRESEGQDAANDARAFAMGDANGIGGQVDPHAGRCPQGSGARSITGLSGTGNGPVANGEELGSSRRDAAALEGRAEPWRETVEPQRRSSSPWSDGGWVAGHDGKYRRTPEPSIRLLAHGVPARVGRLRAYGNAIVPQVAAEVIGAYLDSMTTTNTSARRGEG